MNPTSTQIGAIAENLVMNTLIIESNGRLSPFSPIADDDGIDILVYDKNTGRAVPVQVKSRTKTMKKRGSEERGDIVHFEIRSATFKSDGFAYLIGVLLSKDLSKIDCSWLIPMRTVQRMASKTSVKYVIRANKKQSSKDKYSEFRCKTGSDLANKLTAIFDNII